MGYLFRFDNCFLELICTSLNVIFFTMEMKYLLCHELVINIGEVGSVEIENFFATLFVLGSIYGTKIFEMTLGETFGFISFLPGSGIQWKYVIAAVLIPL